MELKPLFGVMLALIFLLVGFAYAYFTPTPTYWTDMPFTAITTGMFLAGTIFFGYLAFIPALIFGLQLGTERNAAIFLYIIPSIIATYAGTKVGFLLQDDFNMKKNFIKQAKTILFLLVLSLGLALVIELTLPTIINFWPKDLLGMNVKEGKNALGLIGEISKLARK